MSTQRQLRRNTSALLASFTGAVGETVYDTDTKRLINHDGATTGGIPLPSFIDVQNNLFTAADGAGTNTITLTLATVGKAPTAYAEYQKFFFKPAANNTGAVTLNIDSLGAKDVKKDDGAGALVALETDDLKQNIPVEVIYDGTQFIAQLAGGGGGIAYDVLATSSPTGVSSVDFTGIDQTYRALMLKWTGLSLTGAGTIRFASDFGGGFNVDLVDWDFLKIVATTVTGSALLNATMRSVLVEGSSVPAASAREGFLVITNYASTDAYKEYHLISQYGTANVGTMFSGGIATALALGGLRVESVASGNFDAGTFTLIGIK